MKKKKKLTFVTGNEEKISDIRKMLGLKYEIHFIKNIKLPEIQSLDVIKVVEYKAKRAFEKLNVPVVVSDSGLEIDALKKFPGALVKYVNETIGQNGLIKLLEGERNRQANFVAAIAFCDSINNIQIFLKRDKGKIAENPRGDGWHFDRIFIPEGNTKTWAEIGRKDKNSSSAFRRALTDLTDFLETNF